MMNYLKTLLNIVNVVAAIYLFQMMLYFIVFLFTKENTDKVIDMFFLPKRALPFVLFGLVAIGILVITFECRNKIWN